MKRLGVKYICELMLEAEHSNRAAKKAAWIGTKPSTSPNATPPFPSALFPLAELCPGTASRWRTAFDVLSRRFGSIIRPRTSFRRPKGKTIALFRMAKLAHVLDLPSYAYGGREDRDGNQALDLGDSVVRSAPPLRHREFACEFIAKRRSPETTPAFSRL